MRRLDPTRVERLRLAGQAFLAAVALLAAGGAAYRYLSTRDIPREPARPTIVATPRSGPVGLHALIDVGGWPRGATVTVELCAPGTPGSCVPLGSAASPGRIRAAPIPASLPGPKTVDPGPYQLRATSPGHAEVVERFVVVPFAIAHAGAPRSFATVELRTLRIGEATQVATGAPCSSGFTPDGRIVVGRSLVDPRTAISVDLTVSASELAWSPSGDRLGLVTEDRKEVRMAKADGSEQTVVVREARGVVSSLSWAPQGDKVAYVAGPVPGLRGGPARATAYELDLLEGQRRAIGPADAVAWSPSGDRLAIELAGGIHLTDLSGKGPKVADGRAPAWSPDGVLLAYVHGGEPGRGVIVRADAPANALQVDAGVCGLAFAPDGRRIVTVAKHPEGTRLSLRSVG